MLQWKGGGVNFQWGGMAEWFKAAVLKTASRKSGTWVRILLPPPKNLPRKFY
jgi:hypothetical protein